MRDCAKWRYNIGRERSSFDKGVMQSASIFPTFSLWQMMCQKEARNFFFPLNLFFSRANTEFFSWKELRHPILPRLESLALTLRVSHYYDKVPFVENSSRDWQATLWDSFTEKKKVSKSWSQCKIKLKKMMNIWLASKKGRVLTFEISPKLDGTYFARGKNGDQVTTKLS